MGAVPLIDPTTIVLVLGAVALLATIFYTLVLLDNFAHSGSANIGMLTRERNGTKMFRALSGGFFMYAVGTIILGFHTVSSISGTLLVSRIFMLFGILGILYALRILAKNTVPQEQNRHTFIIDKDDQFILPTAILKPVSKLMNQDK